MTSLGGYVRPSVEPPAPGCRERPADLHAAHRAAVGRRANSPLGARDFAARTIHRPKPRGGEHRAFTVPLSGAALEVLRRRQAENQVLGADGGWVFPSKE